MIHWMKQHRTMTTIISLLLIVTLLGGYWYNRSEKIHQAKQDIQFANQILSKFHQQKTLYQKVGFLLNTLPDSNNKSLFCDYHYSIGYPDNGWREAKPDMIKVSSTTKHNNVGNYEVLYMDRLFYYKGTTPKITSFKILDKKTNIEYYLDINNNWKIIKCTSENNHKVSSEKQDKLLKIGEKEAELVLKKYHVSY